MMRMTILDDKDDENDPEDEDAYGVTRTMMMIVRVERLN